MAFPDTNGNANGPCLSTSEQELYRNFGEPCLLRMGLKVSPLGANPM